MDNYKTKFKGKTDRELIESMVIELESIKLEIGKLNENLIDTHELMNDISSRMINK